MTDSCGQISNFKDIKKCPRGRPRGQGRPQGLHLWFKDLVLKRTRRPKLLHCSKHLKSGHKKLCCPQAQMTRRWARQLVTRFDVMQRV